MSKELNKNVFILGDSTSMTVGCENHMYPYLLADTPVWEKNTKIKNYSLAGNTTSDIASLFFNFLKYKIKMQDIIIIYLGNCDAASSEILKGNYNVFHHIKNKIKATLAKTKKKSKIKNKLYYYSWNNSFDPDLEFAVNTNTFKYNLKKIIKECNKKECKVILIKADANKEFIPGVGKGNFIFYKYLGLEDKLSHKLNIDDKRFIKALEAQENNDYKKALTIYNSILLENDNFQMSQEYSLMIVNNIAVIKAELKLYKEAEYIFTLLLKEKYCRKEIIYFNLAQIARLKNHNQDYNKYKLLSYEEDSSLFRIRQGYKQKIEEIKSELTNISLIEMESIIKQSDFLDHCHLTLNGQKILTEAILTALDLPSYKDKNKAVIENNMYNPETYRGNFENFTKYYNFFSGLNRHQIKNNIEIIFAENKKKGIHEKKISEIESYQYDIENALKYYTKHPLFEVIEDLKINTPLEPYDVGRFPEYFLTRLIIPYLKEFEKLAKSKSLFNSKILRNSKDLKKILMDFNISKIASFPDELLRKKDKKRISRILNKSKLILHCHLKLGNQIYERKKTTIFWYFRETLRFGSHSRFSMLYDRVTLEYVAEALVVAYLLENKWNSGQKSEIISLIKLLDKIVNIHERFCFNIHKNNYNKVFIKDYEQSLYKLQKMESKNIL